MSLNRRQFLTSGGAALATSGTIGTASAEPVENIFERLPESVSVDLNGVETYEPALQTSHLDILPEAVYAARFTSPDRETDCYTYWTRYPWQTGWTTYDSHQRDREPVYVFVRPDGSIKEVAYSTWHWLAAINPPARLKDDTHPVLFVAKPHHQYVLSDGVVGGEYVTRKPLVALDNGEPTSESAIQQWFANGWTDIDLDVLLDPWRIRNLKTWWSPEAGFGVGLDTRARFWLSVYRALPWMEVTSDL